MEKSIFKKMMRKPKGRSHFWAADFGPGPPAGTSRKAPQEPRGGGPGTTGPLYTYKFIKEVNRITLMLEF